MSSKCQKMIFLNSFEDYNIFFLFPNQSLRFTKYRIMAYRRIAWTKRRWVGSEWRWCYICWGIWSECLLNFLFDTFKEHAKFKYFPFYFSKYKYKKSPPKIIYNINFALFLHYQMLSNIRYGTIGKYCFREIKR